MEFKFNYDYEHDILSIYKFPVDVEESVEISENIVIDIDKNEKVVGIEIFDAGEFFNTFNEDIDKRFLKYLDRASFELKEFRNQWFIIAILVSNGKAIKQSLPPLRKSEYLSPLINGT
ncbi:DUF2283 domain-containing protein [Candidatus Pacearchaeota archaeon]|nr:DUF2283 domain-containing protein [Candidatus Pacearchaeota archaeon]